MMITVKPTKKSEAARFMRNIIGMTCLLLPFDVLRRYLRARTNISAALSNTFKIASAGLTYKYRISAVFIVYFDGG